MSNVPTATSGEVTQNMSTGSTFTAAVKKSSRQYPGHRPKRPPARVAGRPRADRQRIHQPPLAIPARLRQAASRAGTANAHLASHGRI